MSPHHAIRQPGDLAHRIATRRSELGLSRDELAERAGIDLGYLEYLETRAGAMATGAAMLRLATALETTLTELEIPAALGPDCDEGGPDSEARVVVLNASQCERRLAAEKVGRVVHQASRGPAAYPVNYVYDRGDVVFTTSPQAAADILVAGAVSFEIDRFDETRQDGWSVLATGSARAVVAGNFGRRGAFGEPGLPAGSLRAAPAVRTWAGPGRGQLVRIEISELSGRAIKVRCPCEL